MKIKNRHVYIFDNKGETMDRYTILIGSTGEILGCNETPFAPMGIGQHCGNAVDNRMNITFGYSWRDRCNVKKCIKEEVENYVNEARNDSAWLGVEVTEVSQLPEDVILFITQNL